MKKGWDKATQIGVGLSRAMPDSETVGGSARWPTPIANFKEAYNREKAYDESGGGTANYKSKKRKATKKSSKSPAKIAPLVAMAGKALIGSAVSGMMNKDK